MKSLIFFILFGIGLTAFAKNNQYDQNGRKNGLWVEKSWSGLYKKGLKDGYWLEKSSKGILKRKILYKDNFLDGISSVYYYNGNLAKTVSFRKNILSGDLVIWPSKKKSKVMPITLQFENGMLVGGLYFPKNPPSFTCVYQMSSKNLCDEKLIFFNKANDLPSALSLPKKNLTINEAKYSILFMNGINIADVLDAVYNQDSW